MSDCPVYCNDHDHEKVLHITETALKELREENARMKAVVDAARHIKETWDITDVSGVVPKLHPNELERNDSLAAGAIISVIEALKALDETGKGSAG